MVRAKKNHDDDDTINNAQKLEDGYWRLFDAEMTLGIEIGESSSGKDIAEAVTAIINAHRARMIIGQLYMVEADSNHYPYLQDRKDGNYAHR